MAITEAEFEGAEARADALRRVGHAVAVRYDRRRSRVVVRLSTGVEVTFPVGLVEGLVDASPDDLAEIEITPAGLGLHWPKLDADLYLPALLQGEFGSKRWMAAGLGAEGGKARPRPRRPLPAQTAAEVGGPDARRTGRRRRRGDGTER